MSDLTSPVFLRRIEITQTISELQQDIERIDRTIAQKRLWLASYDEQKRFFKNMLEVAEESIEPPEDNVQEDETIRKLRELIGKDCQYGNVPFHECSYVHVRLAEADKNMVIDLQKRREDKRVASERERLLEVLEQQRKNHDQIVTLFNELRQKLSSDIAEKHKQEFQLSKHRNQLQRLDYCLKQREQALDMITGRIPSTQLNYENARTTKLHEIIELKQDELRRLQESHDIRLKSINEIYDEIIKSALSKAYSGAIRMSKGELQFHIEEATGLSGEAVETLALVLADVMAMICSCQGIGHHPRFLLHDSPREADLDRHIYSRYLQSMWKLTNKCGGRDRAPFQYIVTTTTKPPEELKAAICLHLKAHPENDLLLRRRLVNPPTYKKLELFGEEE
jgi:hypothetical protein